MSILKKKALFAHKRYVMMNNLNESEIQDIPLRNVQPFMKKKCVLSEHQNISVKNQFQAATSPSKPMKPSNNIMKNYSRALVNFALSGPARPYLDRIIERENITHFDFEWFVSSGRKKVNCIKSLRGKLLITAEDSERIAGCKRAFRDICEVFLKTFSVNWIFNSKISDRKTHLMYRFKILRRVRNPENFTYLEGPKRNTSSPSQDRLEDLSGF